MSARPREREWLRALADRAEITDVVHRYARAVEHGDAELFASCFALDGVLDYGADIFEGRAEIRTHFAENAGSSRARVGGIDAERVSTPIASNVEIVLDSDRASVEVSATVYHAGFRGSDAVVIVRGIHYTDDWQRTGDGWQIARRRHRNRWAFETPASGIWRPDGTPVGSTLS